MAPSPARLFVLIYGLDRFDSSDALIFIAHRTDDVVVPFNQAEYLRVTSAVATRMAPVSVCARSTGICSTLLLMKNSMLSLPALMVRVGLVVTT